MKKTVADFISSKTLEPLEVDILLDKCSKCGFTKYNKIGNGVYICTSCYTTLLEVDELQLPVKEVKFKDGIPIGTSIGVVYPGK